MALFVLGLGVALYGLAVRFLPLEAMGPGEGVMEKTAIAGNAAVFAGPVGNEKEAAR